MYQRSIKIIGINVYMIKVHKDDLVYSQLLQTIIAVDVHLHFTDWSSYKIKWSIQIMLCSYMCV